MANSKIKPIRTEKDYEAALARIDALMDAEPGSAEFDELDVLADLVELYESKHEPMGYPSPVAAIEFRMEQGKLSPRDLIPFIGSRAKVSEVLSGKRAITMPMARALHEHLGIPADVLLREAGVALGDPLAGLEWSRFPVKAMAKLDWIPDSPDLAGRAEDAEEIIRDLIDRAGGPDVAGAALYRKNDHVRANAKMDPYALKAWCWQVLAEANEERPKAKYKRGTVTLDFLKKVAQLSWSEDGARLAREFLAKHGIPLVIVKHLPKTYLDGAALRLGDGRPVVALTLRYDRIDNFWFCLLHELACRPASGQRQGQCLCRRSDAPQSGRRTGRSERDAGGRLGGRGPHPKSGLGSERREGPSDAHGRHESGQCARNSPGDCRGQGPIRTAELPPAVSIRRHRRSPTAVRHGRMRQRFDD